MLFQTYREGGSFFLQHPLPDKIAPNFDSMIFGSWGIKVGDPLTFMLFFHAYFLPKTCR